MGAVMEFEDFTVCYRRLKYKIDRAFPLELGLEKGVRQKLLKQRETFLLDRILKNRQVKTPDARLERFASTIFLVGHWSCHEGKAPKDSARVINLMDEDLVSLEIENLAEIRQQRLSNFYYAVGNFKAAVEIELRSHKPDLYRLGVAAFEDGNVEFALSVLNRLDDERSKLQQLKIARLRGDQKRATQLIESLLPKESPLKAEVEWERGLLELSRGQGACDHLISLIQEKFSIYGKNPSYVLEGYLYSFCQIERMESPLNVGIETIIKSRNISTKRDFKDLWLWVKGLDAFFRNPHQDQVVIPDSLLRVFFKNFDGLDVLPIEKRLLFLKSSMIVFKEGYPLILGLVSSKYRALRASLCE